MTEKERELAEKYLNYKLAEREASMNANKVRFELRVTFFEQYHWAGGYYVE